MTLQGLGEKLHHRGPANVGGDVAAAGPVVPAHGPWHTEWEPEACLGTSGAAPPALMLQTILPPPTEAGDALSVSPSLLSSPDFVHLTVLGL